MKGSLGQLSLKLTLMGSFLPVLGVLSIIFFRTGSFLVFLGPVFLLAGLLLSIASMIKEKDSSLEKQGDYATTALIISIFMFILYAYIWYMWKTHQIFNSFPF